MELLEKMELKNLIDLEAVKKRFVRVNVYDAKSEIGYQARRNSVSMAARKVANLGGDVIGNSADILGDVASDTITGATDAILGPQIASNLGVFAGAMGKGIAGIAGMGLAASVSAGFTQMDFIHQKSNLKNLYIDELAEKLHKPAQSVTVRDMEMLAKHNAILSEELARAKRQRNFAVPLAITATLISFAVVMVALPALLPTWAGVGGFSGFMIKAGVSALTYLTVKTPLQMLGNKLFHLRDETTNDRIVELTRAHAKGIAITPEDLAPLVGKTSASSQALDELAAAINSGAIDATSLPFAGIDEHAARRSPEPVVQAASSETRSFQDRLGQAGRDSSLSFAERVSRQAAAEADAQISRYTT